jgi:hypothetical protein
MVCGGGLGWYPYKHVLRSAVLPAAGFTPAEDIPVAGRHRTAAGRRSLPAGTSSVVANAASGLRTRENLLAGKQTWG